MHELSRAFVGAALFLSVAASAESFIAVPLRVEPPQSVRAMVLNAGGELYPCEVRDGAILVPASAPLPWTVAQLRFEPTVYTARDREMKAPLLLRALGELRVQFRPAPAPREAVKAWLLQNGEQIPEEMSFKPDDGSFRTSLPSGTYAGAFFTDSRGSRIRSGIVIAPGKVTELGELALEPTGSVTLRVVDAKSRRPVTGARVTWSPPAALNADVARHLFSRAWSATTDRAGLVAFRAIGPPPVPVRWSVEARGYAPALTQQVLIGDVERKVLADTPLRPESFVILDFLLPRDGAAFHGASLVVSEPEDEEALRYEPFLRQPLRERENKLKLGRSGRLRFSIESKDARKLLYVDRDISPDGDRFVLAPIATEISGTVRRQNLPVEGVAITVADGRDARMIVGKATTDRSGRYAISTFQSGQVLLYASGPYESRAASASTMAPPIFRTLQLAGEREVRVDLQLPTSGATIAVIDAESRAPLRARVEGSLTETGGRMTGVSLETDERGTARIAGARKGKAKVFVTAKGYRGREIALDVGDDTSATTVALTRGGSITGRVVDPAGTAVAGAQILGGYPAPMAIQGHFRAVTDASGRFEIEGAESGTTFYIVARSYALVVSVMREDGENLVRLVPPNPGAVRLVAGPDPPKTLEMYIVAPQGSAIIPYGVFHELATANAVSSFQLNSAGKDGTLILPEFLSPGSYRLLRVRPTGKPWMEEFDHIADLRVPARPGSIVTIPE